MDSDTYRALIDQMGLETVIWRPYRDYGGRSEDVIELRCTYRTMLLEDQFLGMTTLFQVEWVSRQFGMAQDVPLEPYVWVRVVRASRRARARPRPTRK